MWFKYGLKAQKLLAQGIALGIMAISKAPCKGKSFVNCLEFLKLLPLQGDRFADVITQGVLPWAKSFCPFRACCLGLRASAPYLCFTLRPAISNSLRPVTVGSGRAAYLRNLNKVIKNHDSNRGMDGEMV